MASLNEEMTVSTWIPPSSVSYVCLESNIYLLLVQDIYLESIKFEVDFLTKQTKGQTFENKKIEEVITREFIHQVFTVDQVMCP